PADSGRANNVAMKKVAAYQPGTFNGSALGERGFVKPLAVPVEPLNLPERIRDSNTRSRPINNIEATTSKPAICAPDQSDPFSFISVSRPWQGPMHFDRSRESYAALVFSLGSLRPCEC